MRFPIKSVWLGCVLGCLAHQLACTISESIAEEQIERSEQLRGRLYLSKDVGVDKPSALSFGIIYFPDIQDDSERRPQDRILLVDNRGFHERVVGICQGDNLYIQNGTNTTRSFLTEAEWTAIPPRGRVFVPPLDPIDVPHVLQLDRATLSPVCELFVSQSRYFCVADSAGVFVIQGVPVGTHAVRVFRSDFQFAKFVEIAGKPAPRDKENAFQITVSKGKCDLGNILVGN